MTATPALDSAPVSPLPRWTGALTVGIGLFLAAFAVSRALGATPPPLPLTLTLASAATLYVALGVGVARRSRVAWAFAVALSSVSALSLLLAVPALMRGGIHPAAAVGAIALCGVLLALLTSTEKHFRA